MYKFKVSAKRSNLMRKIRSDKTTPEILLQKALRKEKIKFRRNCASITGRPDIALIDKKIAVFVDGEFWHGYCWKQKKRKIKDNRGYWIPKIERNKKRDKEASRHYKKLGWKIIRVWEHDLFKSQKLVCRRNLHSTNQSNPNNVLVLYWLCHHINSFIWFVDVVG